MKSLACLSIVCILLITFSCNSPEEDKISYTKRQEIASGLKQRNDSLISVLDSKGYSEYYQRALFYFKYEYFGCYCYGYDKKTHTMSNAKFLLNNIEEKRDTFGGKPYDIVKLGFYIFVRDTVQCQYYSKMKMPGKIPLKSIDKFGSLVYGYGFSKKDNSLLLIYNYDCGSAQLLLPEHKRYVSPYSLSRYKNFQANRHLADDTLNYLFEKYKGDSAIFY